MVIIESKKEPNMKENEWTAVVANKSFQRMSRKASSLVGNNPVN